MTAAARLPVVRGPWPSCLEQRPRRRACYAAWCGEWLLFSGFPGVVRDGLLLTQSHHSRFADAGAHQVSLHKTGHFLGASSRNAKTMSRGPACKLNPLWASPTTADPSIPVTVRLGFWQHGSKLPTSDDIPSFNYANATIKVFTDPKLRLAEHTTALFIYFMRQLRPHTMPETFACACRSQYVAASFGTPTACTRSRRNPWWCMVRRLSMS